MSYLRSILPIGSLLLLFPLLIFSYQPVILLGMASNTHIDISLLYIICTLVLLVHIPFLIREVPRIKPHPMTLLLGGYLSFTWLSIWWSPNPLRGIFTASFLTLLIMLAIIVAKQLPQLHLHSKRIQQYSLAAFILVALVALWQIITDSLGLTHLTLGLPAMYSGDVFGIARPIGFALEPQFFGSLLLLPFLWAAWKLLTTRTSLVYGIIFASAGWLLLLTLSRGAILAAAIGLLILIITVRPSIKRIGLIVGLGIISISLWALTALAVGTIRDDSISGYGTLRAATSQLSFGAVTLPAEETASALPEAQNGPPEPGYVADSTDSRLSMSAQAIDIWQSSPSMALFGVGIGGFGARAHEVDPRLSPSSIVNNHYIEQLVEIGILGAGLFVSILMYLIALCIRRKQYLLLALLAAYSVQWLFFSGNANVIHIWIVLGVTLGVLYYSPKDSSATIN